MPAAQATAPDSVTSKLDGCNNDGSIVLPNGAGNFICPDAAYTTGNLGKGWNELDLVPFRLTVDAQHSAPATQTYTVAAVVDNQSGGKPGYDVLSVPVLNVAKSDATCSAPTVGAETVLTPGIGGIDKSLYRLVTITQARDTTCVYDYYARLALGSHLFSGSSLHADLANENLGTAGTGAKDVSIPVNEISPQSIAKDMTATQGTDHVWNVVKKPTPATVNFSNTCDPSASLSASASITVTWTKQAATATGPITVITHVYATNPAARVITVNVSDDIMSGTTLLDTATGGPIDMPANTANILILSHTTTVPSGTTNLNDVATASYTDKVTGVAVPGTTTAHASATVQTSGIESNASATITDVESITGSGLSYSVDSFSGATGSFDGGYVATTPTTGSVSWTSTSQSGSGSVTFNKTIYTSAATVVTGKLSDTATLTGSEGFTTSADAKIDLSTNASTSLTVSKTTSLKLASPQTFTFHLYDGSNTATGNTATVNMPALSNGPTSSNTITGLSPTGTYYFMEDATAPYAPQTTSGVTFALNGTLASCSATISVVNAAAPATAQVKKDTVPATTGNWTFELTGPGGLSETLNNVQAGGGYLPFQAALDTDGGTYTITETQQSGYDLTAVSGDLSGSAVGVSTDATARTCSFTIDLAADSGKVFECAFLNTQRGALKVHKMVVKNDAGNTLTGNFTICIAGLSYPSPTVANGGCQTVGANGGDVTWSNILPGDYTVSEVNPGTPWMVAVAPQTVTVDPGATATTALSTVTNTRKGLVKVIKTVSNHDGSGTAAPSGTESFTFTLRSGATNIIGHPGTVLETELANAADGGIAPFNYLLTPGQHYQICETIPDVGWLTSLPNQFVPEQYMADGVTLNPGVINNVECSDFAAAPGPDPTVFQVDNRRPPGGKGFTIGYWKNWASCTKSALKSKNALDQTLFLFGSNGLVVSAGSGGYPIFAATYYLKLLAGSNSNQATDCAKAVNLLNKSTVTGGTKMASDPAFNLAAQLVAAELNYKAGGATSVTSQINQAVLLLGKYHFNGNTHTTISAADAATMNSLALTLDLYNNGLI